MILDPNEKEAYKVTIAALKTVNDGLAKLRELKIACCLREHDGRYFLDAKAIITTVSAMD